MMNKWFCTLVVVMSFSWALQAGNTAGFEFLRTDFSARSSGLASACLTMRADLEGLALNPAGLAYLSERKFAFNYTNYLLDINGGTVAYSQQVPYLKRVAVSITYLDYGQFDETDRFAVSTGNTFSANDIALAVTQADHLDQNFSYGITTKFAYSRIADYTATAWLFDFGLLYRATFESELYFAVTLQNLGWQLNSYSAATNIKEPMPTSLNVGVSKKLAHLPLEVSFRIQKLNESSEKWYDRFKRFSVGGEFRLSDHFHFRLGYNHEQHESLQSDVTTQGKFAGISLGVGIFVKKFRIDYAFSNFEFLGNVHRFGISGSLN
ncbi:type IX secretion system protein PorQ [Calditrichota bacterium LG25]